MTTEIQNVYAGGSLLATYTIAPGSAPTLYFNLNDWLGTKRLELNSSGQAVSYWASDPFGNYLTQKGSGSDATEEHFTGKERDTESGNDYFGARYYANSMGRWMSPDWSAAPDAIPYGDLQNPQSLNLYAYVLNNPLKSADIDGHTHQECKTSNTVTTDSSGNISVTVSTHCTDVPDWWNFGTNISTSYNRFINWVNSNVEAHRPPPQKQNGMEALQDLNNLMMGLQAVPYSPKFGFQGGAKFRQALKELMQPGTHETVAGEVPTRAEATDMIQRAGGQVTRGGAGEPMDPGEEFGHDPGGVSDHTYPHINYETASGAKATVKVSNE